MWGAFFKTPEEPLRTQIYEASGGELRFLPDSRFPSLRQYAQRSQFVP
jgi:hypothetical protein